MGRLPKPAGTARNRNATLAALSAARLGATDRAECPKYPLRSGGELEREIWGELWLIPQAVMWLRNQWIAPVARYARLLAQLEEVDPTEASYPKLLQAAQQLEDRLGLSPLAMQRLRWVIEDAEPVADEPPVETVSARERIKATA